MKPIIAVLAEVENDGGCKIKSSYIHAVEKSGGVPILIPYIEDVEAIECALSVCDGFCFTGGADVHPKHYGEVASAAIGEIKELRDSLEFSVMERALASGKPILAICRGMQLLNVALGGKLYQDIPTELETDILHRQTEPNNAPSHDALLTEGSPLHSLTGKSLIAANSFHHQAVKTLGRGLRVMATAPDGIIEGIWADGSQYIRAYQWHPERLCDIDADNKKIFDDFVAAAKSAKN